MELVKCTQEYWEDVRLLRNMDGVKQGFIQQQEISFDNHVKYMKKNNKFFYICVDIKKKVLLNL